MLIKILIIICLISRPPGRLTAPMGQLLYHSLYFFCRLMMRMKLMASSIKKKTIKTIKTNH